MSDIKKTFLTEGTGEQPGWRQLAEVGLPLGRAAIRLKWLGCGGWWTVEGRGLGGWRTLNGSGL